MGSPPKHRELPVSLGQDTVPHRGRTRSFTEAAEAREGALLEAGSRPPPLALDVEHPPPPPPLPSPTFGFSSPNSNPLHSLKPGCRLPDFVLKTEIRRRIQPLPSAPELSGACRDSPDSGSSYAQTTGPSPGFGRDPAPAARLPVPWDAGLSPSPAGPSRPADGAFLADGVLRFESLLRGRPQGCRDPVWVTTPGKQQPRDITLEFSPCSTWGG